MKHLILTRYYSESRNQYFYMPSLLDMLSLAEIESHRIFSSMADPMLICFPNGWPRAGVFCCLQVFLIQQRKWRLVLERGRPKLIAQNCVMLSPPNSTCVITLIDSFSYLEVHINVDDPQKEYRQIRRDILKGIDASCRTLRYDKEQPHLAFFCPCGLSSPSPSSSGYSLTQRHAAELIRREGSLRCTVDETVSFPISNKHAIWLSDSTSSTMAQANVTTQIPENSFATSAQRITPPTMEYILCKNHLKDSDVDKECSDGHILAIYPNLLNWEQVAFHLGLKLVEIEAIEHKAGNNIEVMRLYALQKWKSVGIIKGNGTYRVLIKALLECGCTEQAQHVCTLLKSTVHKLTSVS